MRNNFNLKLLLLSAVFITVVPTALAQCGMSINISASPQPHMIGTNITLNSSVSGGVLPYTYSWEPNAFFVSPSTNTQLSPLVSPLMSVVYTLTVKGANGCKQTRVIEVLTQSYAVLDKVADGGYYSITNNKLPFMYKGQYATTTLTYKIYDGGNNVVASNPGTNINSSTVVNNGDNRYYLNTTSLAAGYYLLEVTNEKLEKFYLRFVK